MSYISMLFKKKKKKKLVAQRRLPGNYTFLQSKLFVLILNELSPFDEFRMSEAADDKYINLSSK